MAGTEWGRGLPNPTEIVDSALNDSNKSVTVPAGHIYETYLLHVKLISTATVGNRQIAVRLLDASGATVWSKNAGAVQAASLTRNYLFGADFADAVAFDANGDIRTLLDRRWLPAGWQIQVLDSAAIDAAADDMTVRLLVDDQNTSNYG